MNEPTQATVPTVRVSDLDLPAIETTPLDATALDATVITITDRGFEAGAALLIRSLRRVHPTTHVAVYALETLSDEFYRLVSHGPGCVRHFEPTFAYRGQGWQTFAKPHAVESALRESSDVIWLDADCVVVRSLSEMPRPCFTDHGYHKPKHETAWSGEQCPNAGVFRVTRADREFVQEWRRTCETHADSDPLGVAYYDQASFDALLWERCSQLQDGRIWTDFRHLKSSTPGGFIDEVFSRESAIVHLGDRVRPWESWKV